MKDLVVAITAASYSGNKGAAAMLQSSISQLQERYGERLNINLMSVYPGEDRKQVPYDFVKIVPAKPEQLVFFAFPMAILHRVFRWCGPVRKLLEKNKIIKAYRNTDLVIDEAGISFVDSRGFVMNTYAFICAAVPLLVGTPVVKYSQAMGTFHNPWNRFLAKWILPKLKLICARGQGTYDNLKEIGITENVKLCADGAFTMKDDPTWQTKVQERCEKDAFFKKDVVGLSISSVVQKKCGKMGIDYQKIMADFISCLNQKGYGALMIANAARINSAKPRNNDLMIGDAIYESLSDQSKVRWYHEEMDAEEIREYISHCKYLVASRFHAMIGALEKKVPVLLIGWSHKYQEVLDMFELGQYAADFSNLNMDSLQESFEKFEKDEGIIREKLEKNHAQVMKSSYRNIQYIGEVIDEILKQPGRKAKLLDYDNPEYYVGDYLALRKGYAKEQEIRDYAASGGMVTALLCNMLRRGDIDGAWVTRTDFVNDELTYKTYIATTEQEIREASSSVYMSIPLLKHIDLLEQFPGKAAVVMTPCMMHGLERILEKRPELKEKVVLKLGLYCSGGHDIRATTLSMEKAGISPKDAERLYYRRGHWRGMSSVLYKNGEEKTFSYAKLVCAYKNAYFFEKASCMSCRDHFAKSADISFGDIWLKEMKKVSIKHTSCVIRNQKALDYFNQAVADGVLEASHISGKDMVRSQKRALVFKYRCADTSAKRKWNHKLAYFLAEKNRKFSVEKPEKLSKLPSWFIYYYMCFIRVLLSF
ncbi:MAG: hypothetical protein HFH50_03225 [Lachnospiraceae bacterium]|jgi:coenzyme F420-reducing hydrogenase beta subunit|nr:hypothetical protein [Lachnospiraceae bacterium]